MSYIEQQKYLKLLRRAAPDVRFGRNLKGQFVATGGGAGMKFTLPPNLSDSLVREKACRVEAELRAVWKDKSVWGERIDAKTHKIVPRKKS